jgi:dienelactone hydrolase
VPAFLLVPFSATAECPAPAITLCHQHAGQYDIGKSEPAGLAGDPMHHTGVALARQGFVVLCPDSLCFEERQSPRKVQDHYAAIAIADAVAPGTELKDEGGLKTGGLKAGDLERFEFLRYVVDGKSLAWKSVLDFKRSVVSLQS